jgi:hypothetical protein
LQSPPYTPTDEGNGVNFASTAVEVDPAFFVSGSAAVSSDSDASSVDTDDVLSRYQTLPEYTTVDDGVLEAHVDMYEATGDDIPLTVSSASSVVQSLDDRISHPPEHSVVARLQTELAAALERCRELENKLHVESEQRNRLSAQLTGLAHQLGEQQTAITWHMDAHSDLKILLADVEHQRDQVETALASQEIKSGKRIEALELQVSELQGIIASKAGSLTFECSVADCAVAGSDTAPTVSVLKQLLPGAAQKALERAGDALQHAKAVPMLSWPCVPFDESDDDTDPFDAVLPGLSSLLDRQQSALVSRALNRLTESDSTATDVVVTAMQQLMAICTKQKQSLAMCTSEFRVLHATIQAREASIQVNFGE